MEHTCGNKSSDMRQTMPSEEVKELITDAFQIAKTLDEEQRKDLLVLLLADILHNNPEKAMRFIVKTRGE